MAQVRLDAPSPVDPVPTEAVTRTGDIWLFGESRVCCGDLLDGTSLRALLAGLLAHAIFADPPYNTSNATHHGGNGQFRHREFKYAHGEMSKAQFVEFLTHTEGAIAAVSKEGAVAFICMDHHHAGEQIPAGEIAFGKRLNIVIWAKSNAGMASLYRSQHEMILVYVVEESAHLNNIELGRYGRNRTKLWNYASVNTRGARRAELELNPTVKPIQLVADAILDVTRPGEIVLDGFLGSGTTLLVAERTRLRAFGLEIDPAYVDVAVTRWMDLKGGQAVLESTGETFDAVRARRKAETPIAPGSVEERVL